MPKLREIVPSPQELLEAGLARLKAHLDAGRPLGIISGWTGGERSQDNAAHKNLVRRARELGYGPIQATGRSQWGPERSLVIPGISKEHLHQLGNEFKQQAVIHVRGRKSARLHYLKAAGDKAGRFEDIGKTHFNKPNNMGVTILKGVGYAPKDDRKPTRAFTFESVEDNVDTYVLEALEIPPMGMFADLLKPTPYGNL